MGFKELFVTHGRLILNTIRQLEEPRSQWLKELSLLLLFSLLYMPVTHAAKTIADNMKVGATSTDFEAVKEAFEKTYSCIGITCADVGGLYDKAKLDYYEDASPCKDKSTSSDSSSSNKGLAIGLGVTAAVVGVLAVGSIMYMAKREKSGNPVFAKGDTSIA